MRFSVLRPAAVVVSAVLAGSVLSVAAPAAAVPAEGCVATELRLPDGLPPHPHSDLRATDSTGRYQVGSITIMGEDDSRPVLWTDGEPRILEPAAGSRSYLIAVNSSGTVLGASRDADDVAQPWLYADGRFGKLEIPADLTAISVRAMNNRGDVVGYGVPKGGGDAIALVWPAGGSPLRLAADGWATAVDINDAGVVIGNVSTDDHARGILWERWDGKGRELTGKGGADLSLRQIRGNWLIGSQTLPGEGPSGVLLTTLNAQMISFPTYLDAVNGSGDVSYSDEKNQRVVERRDGTRYLIDAEGYNYVSHLFERGHALDAAGTREHGYGRAVLWSGCSS